jgi:hypothetical protein
MSMSDSTNTRSSRRPWLIGGGIAAGALALAAGLAFGVFIPQSVISDGNQQESRLNGWFNNEVVALHTCTAKTARAAQVTKGQTDAVDKVLKDAVAGRYGTGNNLDEGKLFSAMHEAYPDLGGLNKSFQDAMAIMTGCQDDFAAAQGVVQSKVSDFKSWRTGSWTVRTFGGNDFPNDNLEVNIAGMDHLIGQQALDLMSRPIADADTVNAIKTGEDGSYKNDPFATPTPTR